MIFEEWLYYQPVAYATYLKVALIVRNIECILRIGS